MDQQRTPPPNAPSAQALADDTALSDKELLLRWYTSAKEAKNHAAFHAIVLRHYERVVRTVLGMVCESQATDIAQTAFLKLSQKACDLLKIDRSDLLAWLCRVARNEATSIVRSPKHKRTRTESTLTAPGGSSPFESVANPLPSVDDDRLQELRTHIEALPEELRDCLEWKLSGLSQTKIAKKLGVSNSVVSRRIARATALLRKRMNPESHCAPAPQAEEPQPSQTEGRK